MTEAEQAEMERLQRTVWRYEAALEAIGEIPMSMNTLGFLVEYNVGNTREEMLEGAKKLLKVLHRGMRMR